MNRKSWKIVVFAVMAVLSVLLSLEVLAQEGDEIRLDETGTVTLTSQEAARAGVSSLQIGLRVDSAEGEKVEFIFAESNAKILEFRYDGEAKQWNLYLAGTEALFAEDSATLTLGRVVVLNGNGEAATATVSVPENSAWYVYGTELRSIESLKLPESVVINAQETDSPEEDDGEDGASQGTDVGNGSTPGAADASGAAGSGSQGATGSGTGAAGSGNQGATGSGTGTAGNGSQGGTGSGSGTAGSGSQGGTGSGTGTAGSRGQGTTGSGAGSTGSGSQGTTGIGSGTGTAGSGSQGTTGSGSGTGTAGSGSGTGTAGNGSQGTGSGSQGNQSISPTVSSSSDAQPANAEVAGKGSEKKNAGINWEIVLIILAILLAAVFGVAAAMLLVKVVTRRR